jgi:hypothetical protein
METGHFWMDNRRCVMREDIFQMANQECPPVEEPPNVHRKPPVKEPGETPQTPPPPNEPPMEEPPDQPTGPPVRMDTS